MITDKDREDAENIAGLYAPYDCDEMAAGYVSTIRAESADQARKEADEKLAIAVKALEKIQKQGTYNPLGGRTLSGERIDSEKIINEYGIIARDALKEIQG